ncbi:MAG: hypothetical protein U5K00_07515 [Melioribacteraceae bacterium]|nr:hypothetical protein [Melioribacteraceae bacterium]
MKNIDTQEIVFAHSESYNEKRLADIQGFYIALEVANNKELERYKIVYKQDR